MSLNSKESPTGPLPVLAEAPAAEARDPAGQLLTWLTVLPVLLTVAWLLAGLPLLLLGWFRPAPQIALFFLVAAVLVPVTLRCVPTLASPALHGTRGRRGRTPWWPVAAMVIIALGFAAWQARYHSQFVIVTRDPASYFQFATWISGHGSLPVPTDAAAFGGTHGVLGFYGYAYYQVGNAVIPQFMAGLPMLLAGVIWIGGLHLALLAPPVLGAAALLAFGGLAARLIGARWAPLAMLILAVSLPQLFTSRTTYSEPLAQIMLIGGLCLVVDALGRQGRQASGAAGGAREARVLAAVAGLALGLTVLVRIDGASDILPVILYCGVLVLARSQLALPLIAGLAVGGGYGLVDGAVLSRPYLAANKTSVIPLAVIGAVAIIVTAIAVWVLWRRGAPKIVRARWLPNAGAALACLVVAAFAVRPYVQTVRTPGPMTPAMVHVAQWEKNNGLPVDPARTFAEISLHWVFWYVGVPAVVFATIGAALLVRRCLRAEAAIWVLPLMVFGWAIVAFLYRPAITPDQPWGSRRLVPAVLPGVILLAVWATAWAVDWLRVAGYPRPLRAAAATIAAVVLVLPAVWTTFGLHVKLAGPGGQRLVADGLATKATYQGELDALTKMCDKMPRNASVVFVDSYANFFVQAVRGVCGFPAARIDHANAAKVALAVRGIEQAGRTPVLLAAKLSTLQRYPGGDNAKQVMNLHTRQDATTLVSPPTKTGKAGFTVWMALP
jgi:hypothetical protein